MVSFWFRFHYGGRVVVESGEELGERLAHGAAVFGRQVGRRRTGAGRLLVRLALVLVERRVAVLRVVVHELGHVLLVHGSASEENRQRPMKRRQQSTRE